MTATPAGALAGLPPAERAIAALLLTGVTSNAALGRALDKSPATIAVQLAALRRRIGVPNRTRLVTALVQASPPAPPLLTTLLPLTADERALARMIIAGWTGKQMAASTGASLAAVTVRLRRLYRVLNVTTRADAARVLLQNKLLPAAEGEAMPIREADELTAVQRELLGLLKAGHRLYRARRVIGRVTRAGATEELVRETGPYRVADRGHRCWPPEQVAPLLKRGWLAAQPLPSTAAAWQDYTLTAAGEALAAALKGARPA